MPPVGIARRISREVCLKAGADIDLSTEVGRGRERNRRAALGSGAGFVARASSTLTSVVTVPLLLHHLGITAYGVWATITAGAAWLGLMQLGIGPSLLNRLAGAGIPQGGRVVSTAIWLGLGIAIAAIAVLIPIYLFAPWNAVFNVVDADLAAAARDTLAIIWVGVAIAVPVGLPATVLRARQQVYLANGVEFATSLTRLVAIVILVAAGASMVEIALGATIAVGLVTLGGSLVALGSSHELGMRSFDRREAGSMLRTGLGFTGVSIAALVIMYTDVLVVTQLFGPAQVPVYALPFAILTLFLSLELVVLDALWPAFSDAAASGDQSWLRETFRRTLRQLLAAAVLFAGGLTIAGGLLVRLWSGGLVDPGRDLLLVLAAIAIVQAIELPHGRILVALGHVRPYTILAITNAAINLPVSIVLAQAIGLVGVAAGTLVGYALVAPAMVILARRAMASPE